MKTIDDLTRREIIAPNLSELDNFVNDWAELYKESIQANKPMTPLIKEVIFRVMAKAYYGEGGQLNIKSLEYDYSKVPQEVFSELRGNLDEINKLPFFKRFLKIPKQKEKIEEYKEYKEICKTGYNHLVEMRERYEKTRKPYEVVARNLADKCGVNFIEISEMLEERRARLPFI